MGSIRKTVTLEAKGKIAHLYCIPSWKVIDLLFSEKTFKRFYHIWDGHGGNPGHVTRTI